MRYNGFAVSLLSCESQQRLLCFSPSRNIPVRFERCYSDTSSGYYHALTLLRALSANTNRADWLTLLATVVPHTAAFRTRVVGDNTCMVQHTTCCTTLECLSCTSALGNELVAGFLLSRTRYGGSEVVCDLLGLCVPLSAASIRLCFFFKSLIVRRRLRLALLSCSTVAYAPLSSFMPSQLASLT
jgi:hypothetical protein